MSYTDPDNEQELIEFERRQDEDEAMGIFQGDPRHCPHHPHVATSSPDGMFDAPCGECEYGMYEDHPATSLESSTDAAAEWSIDAAMAERAAIDDDIPF